MATPKKNETPKVVNEVKPVKIGRKRGPRGPRKPKENKSNNVIHTGQVIAQKMKSKGLSKNKLAKILKLTPPTVSLMVNSSSVQTDRLLAVSEVLDHNFFTEIGKMINISGEPVKATEIASDTRVNNLQGKVADLELELRFLREENTYIKRVIELLAGGKNK